MHLRSAHGRPPGQPPARRVAHDLVSARRVASGDDSAAHAAAAACSHLYRQLGRWIGPDGCHALFTRALMQTRADYPALEQIHLRARSEPYLEGVTGSIAAHGDASTADAIESVLTQVLELLGRLIGDDMTAKLIDQELAESDRREAASDVQREES